MDTYTLDAVTSGMETVALLVISGALAWIPLLLIRGPWGVVVGAVTLGILLIAVSRMLILIAAPRKVKVPQ
jgi:hypothetical protein